jgi:hypothetical protein
VPHQCLSENSCQTVWSYPSVRLAPPRHSIVASKESHEEGSVSHAMPIFLSDVRSTSKEVLHPREVTIGDSIQQAGHEDAVKIPVEVGLVVLAKIILLSTRACKEVAVMLVRVGNVGSLVGRLPGQYACGSRGSGDGDNMGSGDSPGARWRDFEWH